MSNIDKAVEFITWTERQQEILQAEETCATGPIAHWKQDSWGWIKTPLATNLPEQPDDLLAHPLTEDLARQARNGVCETAFCAAGHGAFEAGYRLLYRTQRWNGADGTSRGMQAYDCIEERPTGEKDANGLDIWEVVPGAKVRRIEEVGAEWFGFDEQTATAFFAEDNQLWMMKAFINWLAWTEHGEQPFPGFPFLEPGNGYATHDNTACWCEVCEAGVGDWACWKIDLTEALEQYGNPPVLVG